MKHKFKLRKMGKGITLAVENKKWQDPMKPRIPKTQTHKDPRFPSRSERKNLLREEIKDQLG